jgi:hypothetical protein
MLALGVVGGRVILVDAATGEERWALQAHAGEYSSTQVAMSPSGRFVASVGFSEENWKLWDASSGAAWMAGARHDGSRACICVDELGRRLLQGGCPLVAHTAGLLALALSPCGQRLASGDEDGAVILWDAQTGEAERRIQEGFGTVMSLAFSADGARLACGSWNGSIRVWEAASGALLRTWEQEDDGIHVVQFSPVNTSLLARVMRRGMITLLNVDSGEEIRSFAGRYFVAFAPDGRTIATASANNGGRDVRLVNAETGTVRLTLVGHLRPICAAVFSVDDGSKLASASYDDTCKVWDSSTGALLRTIEVGTRICSVSWGRDWVRDTQTGVAFAMGHHPRLGERSEVLALDEGVVRMILDRV